MAFNQNPNNYGQLSSAPQISAFLVHVFKQNTAAEKKGQPKSPVCIWGNHGIGKTELVQQFAQDNNYPLVYIAPAQFEEMGDLLGMPAVHNERTIFHPPEWVPSIPGPGILLIDDVNRADERILRGIMQLLQQYSLISWSLPEQWQIVLTANPDNGTYAVTPMDDAMTGRMLHISLDFDLKAWIDWALKNDIDQRCIQFVALHPEIFKNPSTTPRSLTRFFENISSIPVFSTSLPLIQSLGAACVDEATVAAFISFIQKRLDQTPSPSSILTSTDFVNEIEKPLHQLIHQEEIRMDILNAVCLQLTSCLQNKSTELHPIAVQNIQSFLKMDCLPNAQRLSFLQDINNSPRPAIRKLLEDADIAMMLLE